MLVIDVAELCRDATVRVVLVCKLEISRRLYESMTGARGLGGGKVLAGGWVFSEIVLVVWRRDGRGGLGWVAGLSFLCQGMCDV